MKMFTSALAILVAASVSEARPVVQDTPGEETRELRIFVLDRTTPDRSFKDAAAVLTLTRKSGRGQTILIPRALKEAPVPADGVAPGMIRGLISTPYFVEMDLGDGAAAPRRESAAPAPTPEDGRKADAAPAPLSADEVLRRSRKGTWFTRKLPASLFSGPFTATVTIRIDTLTFTSEEFQGPRLAHDAPDDAAARVDQTLQTLRHRAEESAKFMDLKPAADELIRDLSKIAPAGFEDGSGEVERHRQWCLALARGIEDATDYGNATRIQDLSLECAPRMKEVRTLLEQMKKREPVPTPATPETPPTVK
jgi:hypothetical protein